MSHASADLSSQRAGLWGSLWRYLRGPELRVGFFVVVAALGVAGYLESRAPQDRTPAPALAFSAVTAPAPGPAALASVSRSGPAQAPLSLRASHRGHWATRSHRLPARSWRSLSHFSHGAASPGALSPVLVIVNLPATISDDVALSLPHAAPAGDVVEIAPPSAAPIDVALTAAPLHPGNIGGPHLGAG